MAGIQGVLGKVGRAQLRHRARLALDAAGLAPFVLKNLLQGLRRVFFRIFAFLPFRLDPPGSCLLLAKPISPPAEADIK